MEWVVILSTKVLTVGNDSKRIIALEKLVEEFISDSVLEDTVEHYTKRGKQILVMYGKDYAGFLSYVHVRGDVHISGLYVAKAYRGKGLAGALLDYCVRWCGRNKGGKFIIGVAADNTSAKNLYIKHGFVVKQTGIEDGIEFNLLERVGD